jgi:hypothetical protein
MSRHPVVLPCYGTIIIIIMLPVLVVVYYGGMAVGYEKRTTQ